MSKSKRTRHQSSPGLDIRVPPEIRHKLNTLGAAKNANPSMFVGLVAQMYAMGVRHSFSEGQWLILTNMADPLPAPPNVINPTTYKINPDAGTLLIEVCRVIQMSVDKFMLFALHDGLQMFESMITPNRHNLPPTIQTAVGKVEVPREN